MRVGEIVDLLKASYLNNLAVSRSDDVIIKFIYLGVAELYNRFNLSIKSEVIRITPDLNLYEVKNPDVSLILKVYSHLGKELHTSDILESHTYDYKLLNYRSFILRNTFDGLLHVVYKAAPILLRDREDYVDLPDAMIQALMLYVASLAHNTINRDNTNEANVYRQRFDNACVDLENQGYKIQLSNETLSLFMKGFR